MSEGPLPPHVVKAALNDTRAVYRHADEAYAAFSCPASGECCQLAVTRREPWLWLPEWLVLLDRVKRDGDGKLPAPREDGGCPFLDAAGRRCTVYADRPFGCRTFFCGRKQGPAHEPVDTVVALSRRLEQCSTRAAPELTAPRPLSEWVEDERSRR